MKIHFRGIGGDNKTMNVRNEYYNGHNGISHYCTVDARNGNFSTIRHKSVIPFSKEKGKDRFLSNPIENNDFIIWDQKEQVHIFAKDNTNGNDENKINKWYLSFEIIDPSWPLYRTSLNTPNPCDLSGTVKNKIKQFLLNTICQIYNFEISIDIVEIIYQMGFNNTRTLDQGKEIRKKIFEINHQNMYYRAHYWGGGNYGYRPWFWEFIFRR